jgi:hypothetical protein
MLGALAKGERTHTLKSRESWLATPGSVPRFTRLARSQTRLIVYTNATVDMHDPGFVGILGWQRALRGPGRRSWRRRRSGRCTHQVVDEGSIGVGQVERHARRARIARFAAIQVPRLVACNAVHELMRKRVDLRLRRWLLEAWADPEAVVVETILAACSIDHRDDILGALRRTLDAQVVGHVTLRFDELGIDRRRQGSRGPLPTEVVL